MIKGALIVEKIRYNNAILLLLLFLTLQICFSTVIKDLYVFEKAAANIDLFYEFSIVRFIAGFSFILTALFALTVLKMRGFLYIILIMTIIFFVFPNTILFVNIKNIDYRIFLSHCILFSTILGTGIIRIQIHSKTFSTNQSRRILLLIVLVGMLPFIVLYLPHLNYKNLLLLEVYETRALMTAKVNNLYTNYAYSWFSKVLIPALFVFGVYFRNRFTIIISSIFLIFLFLCGAHKTVFVGFIMVLILYKFDYQKKANYLIKFIIVLGIISLVASLIFNNDFLMRMTIRRTMFLPALLDILYFDFFDSNHLYWSQSFLSGFFEYPYQYQHYYVIGDTYFNSKVWAANNGIISDGFMNFGILGVIINSIIVGFYFSFLNQLNISGKFFGIFFFLFFAIMSSSFTTVMLSHGGVLLFIVCYFFLKQTQTKMG